MNEKSIKSLNLTEEQLEKFRELKKKEMILERELRNCNVSRNAIPKIIEKSDLNNIDLENISGLDEEIRNEWKDFIIPERVEKVNY